MNKLTFAVAALVIGSSVAQAQKVSGEAMLSFGKDNNVAVSVVSKPAFTVSIGSKLSVSGVSLPSMVYNGKTKKWNPAIGAGLVMKVKKIDLGYNVFKLGSDWTNFYGVVVKF
jgi:hypothetical protein